MNKFSQTGNSLQYQHPMRLIQLSLMPGKTVLTKEDEKLMKKYIHLHDFEYHLLKKSEELYLALYKIEPRLTTLKEYLAEITAMLNESVAMLDKLSQDFYIPDETNLEKIQENNAATAIEMESYSQQLTEVYNDLKYYEDILNTCMQSTDEGGDGDKAYEAYSNISFRHSEHYMDNTIDIASIDIDYEKFCSLRGLHETRRNDFIDRSKKIMDNYNTLNLETNALHKVWLEFSKRCELMQVVSTLHHTNISASIN